MNMAKALADGLRRYVKFEGDAPVYVCANDALVMSGTLVEGIGNVHSDYDTYVICHKRPLFGEIGGDHAICQKRDLDVCIADSDKVFLTTDYIPNSIHHFEVEYWTLKEIQAIASTVCQEYERCLAYSDFVYRSTLTSKEAEFLHRIIVGEIIWGQDLTERSLKLSELKDKYCYLRFRQTSNMYWGFKDILGSVADGQWTLAFETTRDYLLLQIRGLFHLYGVTNQKRRWTLVYLSRIDDPVVQDLGVNTKAILFADASTDTQKQSQIYAMINLCDEIVLIGRQILSSARFALDCVKSIELLDAEMNKRTGLDHPLLKQESAFRRSIYDRSIALLSSILRDDTLIRTQV